MPHPNDMSVWVEIECQRGHTRAAHRSREVTVDLTVPHGYHDYPSVPMHLAPSPYQMLIWDPTVHPVDGGPYCPAHDAVSETIISHHIWEPVETILTLNACLTGPREDAIFLDFGAQIGWFSLLAVACGMGAIAIEADALNAQLISDSGKLNSWLPDDTQYGLTTYGLRVGPTTPPLNLSSHVRLAKIDIEGAEADAVRLLWPMIERGQVDQLIIEVSPVFNDSYAQVVVDLIAAGYRVYDLAVKQLPPITLVDPEVDLAAYRIDGRFDPTEYVNALHQTNMWFVR